MRWQDREQSSHIEDRRGESPFGRSSSPFGRGTGLGSGYGININSTEEEIKEVAENLKKVISSL